MSGSVRPSSLLHHLHPLVPLPSSFVELLRSEGWYRYFRELLRELLPEEEDRILSLPGEFERMTAFSGAISERYCPIIPLEEYAQLDLPIPYDTWHRDPHELVPSVGENLLTCLVSDPYGGIYSGDWRVPLLEHCARHVPDALLRRVPPTGLSPETLHERLDGTRFEAAASLADWIYGETDTGFLDVDEEVEYIDPWGREYLESARELWQSAERIINGVRELAEWLEADPPSRFCEVLDLALDTSGHTATSQRKETNDQ